MLPGLKYEYSDEPIHRYGHSFKSLEELKCFIEKDLDHPLKLTAKNTVFSNLCYKSEMMIIGDKKMTDDIDMPLEFEEDKCFDDNQTECCPPHRCQRYEVTIEDERPPIIMSGCIIWDWSKKEYCRGINIATLIAFKQQGGRLYFSSKGEKCDCGCGVICMNSVAQLRHAMECKETAEFLLGRDCCDDVKPCLKD